MSIVLILLLASTSEEQDAEKYFRAGNQAYRAALYLAAAQAYEDAYARSPLPAIAFSIAQAYRRQYYVDQNPDWLRRALERYRSYLDQVPQGERRDHAVTHIATIMSLLPLHANAIEKPQRPSTQILITSQAPSSRASIDGGAPLAMPALAEVAPGLRRVRVEAPGHTPVELDCLAVEGRLVVAPVDLTPRPATIELLAPDDARVTIDGRLIGEAPLPPLVVERGEHAVVVTQRGRMPFSAQVSIDYGQSLRLDVPLAETEQRIAAYWTLGAAGVLLAGGAVSTGLAVSFQTKANDRLQEIEDDAGIRRYESARMARDDSRIASYTLFAGALACGAVGLFLYLLDGGSL